MDNRQSHIDEQVLERAVFNRAELDASVLERMEEHLGVCKLCAEKLGRLHAFSRGLEEILQEGASPEDQAFASSLLARSRPALPERGLERRASEDRVIHAYAEVMAGDRPSLPGRIVRYVRRNPVRSTAALAVLGALLFYSSTTLVTPKDENPVYAEIRNYTLYVYNKDSKVLWKKGVPGIPDWKSNTRDNVYDAKRLLLVADILGTGTNQILLSGKEEEGSYTRDSLYCFDQKGRLKWKVGAGPFLSFGKGDQAHLLRPMIVDFLAFRRTPASPPQLFVLATEVQFSPSKVFEVDPEHGTVLQSFCNRGGTRTLAHCDIEGTGVERLLVGGVNDGYNRAFLALFDPARVKGYGPVPPEFTPADAEPGSEEYYLMFPLLPHLSATRRNPYNAVGAVTVTGNKEMIVKVMEKHFGGEPRTDDIDFSVFYTLDRSMTARSIMLDDNILRALETQSADRRPGSPADRNSFRALKDSVVYWDGSRFVHTPTRVKVAR